MAIGSQEEYKGNEGKFGALQDKSEPQNVKDLHLLPTTIELPGLCYTDEFLIS